MVFPFSHSPPAGIRPNGSYGSSFVDNTSSDSAVAKLATRILRSDFLQEHWQKDRQLSELQRQNLDLARALTKMQHSNSVLSCHLSYSNQNAVWDMNRRLARLIDQMIDQSSTAATPSRTIADLVSDIEAKEKEICDLKGSLQEQRVVLEHRSHQLAHMEMLLGQQGKHEMAKIPSGSTV
jgi:DNA repair exonuclease SbcCD ATPase subunit